MANIRIGSFDGSGSGDFSDYIAVLKNAFAAHGVTDNDKQRAHLLSAVGLPTYRLVRTLCSPDTPESKTFEELVQLLSAHLSPAPSRLVARWHFNQRQQREEEDVRVFMAAISDLAKHCAFGQMRDELLRDRLVCGIREGQVRSRLLEQPDSATLQQTLDLATQLERASKDSRQLQSHQTVSNASPWINRVGAFANNTQPAFNCRSCGGSHARHTCRLRDAICRSCGKKGHVAKVCGATSRPTAGTSVSSHQQNLLGKSDKDEQCDTAETDPYCLFSAASGQSRVAPYIVDLRIDGVRVSMEVDTGASLTIIPQELYLAHLAHVPLVSSSINLHTYTRQALTVVGEAEVQVEFEGITASLPLLVVQHPGPALLGRNWLNQLPVHWHKLHTVNHASILELFPHLFESTLGTYRGEPVSIPIDNDATPRFYKPRPVPYAYRGKVDEELDRLQNAGVLRPVTRSDWAAPVVPVLKADGGLRLCGDYKVTVNRASKVDRYPLPNISDLLCKLSGACIYSKIDLSQAFLQLPLHEDSQLLLAVNTHKGLFAPTRLPFGVNSAPSIFQRVIDGLLRSVEKNLLEHRDAVRLAGYQDDIVVAGKTRASHDAALHAVLATISSQGLRLRRDKCVFGVQEIEYLGHRVSAEGIRPLEDKAAAIKNAATPANVAQLRSFLGAMEYYAAFIKNKSFIVHPLYALLRKGARWNWTKEHNVAFNKAKEALAGVDVLMAFDPAKPIVLSPDASQYGIGCVLKHSLPNGQERIIACASRTLSHAERNYSVLEKEALATIFGVKKFHLYLFGHHFKITSDHKPLASLLSPSTPVSTHTASRIQRWSLTLGAYDFSWEYRPGHKNADADFFSRFPASHGPDKVVPVPGDTVLLLSWLDSLPVTSRDVKRATHTDPILAQVLRWTMLGWPSSTPRDFAVYFQRRLELSAEDGCLLWGARVVIPVSLRAAILDCLHDGHPGIVQAKSFARSYVWWPGLDADLERACRNCQQCQAVAHKPAAAPSHAWEWPQEPWSRLHVDYAGPFMGKMWLVVVDAHSKWLEVLPTNSTSTESTISRLRPLFAAEGIPNVIVTDNATSFTGDAFQRFCAINGITHRTSPPYHPASNGLAERAVQTFKSAMQRASGPLDSRLSAFLFRYRNTPHCTTGVSPAILLKKRPLKGRLDLLRPDVRHRVMERHQNTSPSSTRRFGVGDRVWAANLQAAGSGDGTWSPGTVQLVLGSVLYTIRLDDGRVWSRHVDFLRPCCVMPEVDQHGEPQAQATTTSSVSGPACNAGQVAAAHQPEAELETPTETLSESVSKTAPLPAPPGPRRTARSTAGVPPSRYGFDTHGEEEVSYTANDSSSVNQA